MSIKPAIEKLIIRHIGRHQELIERLNQPIIQEQIALPNSIQQSIIDEINQHQQFIVAYRNRSIAQRLRMDKIV